MAALILLLAPTGARAQTAPAGQGLVPDATELSALRDFYQATGGAGWNNRTNWLQGTTLTEAATWYGVTVSNGDVTQLNLAANGLVGTVPAGLGQLRALFLLSLQNNQLTGGIPPELGQLGSLRHFNLFNNQLTGILPPTLGKLGNVFYFNLFGNQLSGSIPPELGQMTQVQDFNLFNNQLTGTIPAELGQLRNLRYLNLQSNRLSGDLLPALGPLPQLRQLALFDNRFDFAQLEPLFTGPGASPRAAVFSYAPQALPADEQAIAVTSGQPFSLPSGIGGARTRYQWQRETGGAWQDLPGATAATYQVARAAAVNVGRYRCVAVNDWVTGLTLYSRPFSVQVNRSLPPSNPSNDDDRNWFFTRSYDLNGTVTGESKQFVDAMGRPTQSQTKNLAEHHVFATQSLNNTGGVAVLATLPAPTNNQEFAYKPGFVTAAGSDYGPANFEKPTGSAPDVLDEATPGTLGYYYSQNNAWEPATAATHNPYSLSEPTPGPLGGTRRAAGPGDELRLGSGREMRGRDFPLLNEMDHYAQLRPQFVPGSATPSLRAQGLKTVQVNANGTEAIAFVNREGQALASCLSGDQYPASTLTGTLAFDPANAAGSPVYQDLHVAASTTPAPVTVTDGATGGGSGFVVIDLLQNPAVETAYTGSQSLSLAPGFYRLQATSGQLSFSYPVHYGNFSYVYYDDAGRAVASVAPKGLEPLLANGLPAAAGPTTPAAATAVYRLRAGGSGALTTSRGTFATDQYFSPSPGDVYATTAAVAGTPDPALYQNERYSSTGRFAYALPVANGSYTVVLHFAEAYWTAPGQRVFDVALEGTTVLSRYDIFKKVGALTATTETFPVTVTDGVLNADFSALNSGGVDSPKVCALEVLTAPAPTSSTAVFRLKAGGPALGTSLGAFAADQYFSPAPGNTYTTTAAIAGTPDPALYQTERYGTNGQFAYALPLANGTYTVVLHFAETYFSQVGQRVFDVSMEGSKVLTAYDIVKKVGALTATTETFPVALTDGVLNLDFTANNPGGVDNPKVCAIEVLTAGAAGGGGAAPVAPAFVTRNVFDTSGRVLRTTTPDEGTTRYVYARDGRIRFSQSALQAQPPTGQPARFSYSNYDRLGRVVESGEYTQATTAGQGTVFEDMLTDGPAANSVLQAALLEDRTPTGGLDVSRCAERNQVWYDRPQPDAALGSRQQDFVLGAVAKTSKGAATTWYSYDDRGQLTWLVQQAPVVGVKTVDYTYDDAGNVTRVAYQQGQPDAFYHYYAYDANQRLTQVATSPDGVAQTVQATYFYYLHGPLKRVETAGNLQGTDYTYTVQGWLKGINSANRHFDGDTPNPATGNGFYKDLFGLTLDYFAGDYRSGQAGMATPALANAPATRYDGLVRSAAWFTAANPALRQHVFTYDAKGQLKQADFGLVAPGAQPTDAGTFVPAAAKAYEEGNLAYDANGNLQTLRRRDGAGLATDDFTYRYTAGTNQLAAVNNPAGAPVLDYDYDATGQMTRQKDEQGQRYLAYDATGKVTGVYRDAARTQPLAVFAYDDRGFRASKASYDPVTYQLKHTTYSVRDAAGNELSAYTLDAAAPNAGPQQSGVPLYGASRLGVRTRLADGTLDYRYELNDQLGTARVVYHRPTTATYTASMETGAAGPEEKDFRNVGTTRFAGPVSHSTDKVARLGLTSGYTQGPAKTLTVQPGDTVTFTAYAWLTAAAQPPARSSGARAPLALAAAPLVAAPGAAPPGENGPARGLNPLARVGLGVAVLFGRQPAAPPAQPNALNGATGNAFLRYRVLDANGQEVARGTQEANGSAPGAWQQLQVGLRLQQAGTVELSVEEDGPGPDVYFDDVRVEQTGSTIVQEQHTYAYGAPLPGLSYVIGTKRYRHGYQGQYAEKDEDTGTDAFELRNYDARTGRWTAPDPAGQYHSPYVGMGNNPVSSVDPDGGLAISVFSNWFTNILSHVGIGTTTLGRVGTASSYALNISTQAIVAGGLQIGIGAATTAVRVAGPGANTTTPFQVGWEWLSGTGPRERTFTNGDTFTELLRKHQHIEDTRNIIRQNIAKGGGSAGSNPYKLGGLKGVPLYFKDYSTLLTGGYTGNLAVTYLGSYNLTYRVLAVHKTSALVQFRVENTSTISSATHPPVIGYTDWWNQKIGKPLDDYFSSGPVSKTSQTFIWTETLNLK